MIFTTTGPGNVNASGTLPIHQQKQPAHNLRHANKQNIVRLEKHRQELSRESGRHWRLKELQESVQSKKTKIKPIKTRAMITAIFIASPSHSENRNGFTRRADSG